MSAGSHIDLNSGFVAQSGSVFTALIDDCTDVNSFLADEKEELIGLDEKEKSTINTIINKEKYVDNIHEVRSRTDLFSIFNLNQILVEAIQLFLMN